jgi:hypothetical protein
MNFKRTDYTSVTLFDGLERNQFDAIFAIPIAPKNKFALKLRATVERSRRAEHGEECVVNIDIQKS